MSEPVPLRMQFPKEYNSWRNAKRRAGEEGVTFDPEFENFGDFMKHMGPKPHPMDTLDRVVRTGPYTRENVRWADKKVQANNRSNTRFYEHEGRFIPVTEAAALLDVSPDTLRRRTDRKWSRVKPQKPQRAFKPRRSTKRPSDTANTHSAPALRSEFNWVDPYDLAMVNFWVGLYQAGEDEWHGKVPLRETVKLRDGTVRDETFVEFMRRMDEGMVSALTTGDLTELPNTVSDYLSGLMADHQKQVLSKSSARLERSHLLWLDAQFGRDPLVDDKEAYACDVSWLTPALAMEHLGHRSREAQTRFRMAGVSLPERLRVAIADLSKLPLGRKS